MNRILLSVFAMISLWSCASEPRPEVEPDDAVNDALISFTYNAQAGRYSEALEQITYEDQLKIIDANGDWKPEYKAASKRIKISALQKLHFSLDSQGKLEGMIAVLDEANSKFTMSDEQRSTNLEKVEKNRKAEVAADSAKAAKPAPAVKEAAKPELEDSEELPEESAEPAMEEDQKPTPKASDAAQKGKTDTPVKDTTKVAQPVNAENLDVDELFK